MRRWWFPSRRKVRQVRELLSHCSCMCKYVNEAKAVIE